MVHPSQYRDGVVNPSRPPYPKGHSQSFTAGSNPNSAPMPNFSSQRRRSQPPAAVVTRSYTPQPEPAFDLMAASAPLFGDMNFQMPNYAYDLGSATSSYSTPALPTTSYQDVPFESTTEQYLTHGLADYGQSSFTTNEFAAISGPDTPFSRPALPPSTTKLNSPFTSNGPVLAPPPSSTNGPTTDSIHKNQPQTPRKIIKPKSAAAARNQPLLPAPAGLKTPLGQRDSNMAIKRALPDSPTIEHTSPRKATKRSKTDEPSRHRDMGPIPDAEAFPPVDAGDENSKPPYTYAQMIALAIWKAPSRRRTLSQIYDFIRTTWSYYRKDDTWENSIRHNLSLHKKFFEKQARAKDDPGKGNYWLIIPGNERELLDVYLKERPGHENTMAAKNMAVMATSRLEPSALPAVPQSLQEPMLSHQLPNFQLHFPPEPKLQPPAPIHHEPSSDATIPASEQAFDETDFADGPSHLNNSLDTALTSSPPVSRRASAPIDTPTRIGSSSGRTLGNRKRCSMVDSGYMTGLESSILRHSQPRESVFSSEADTHDFQGGGRAEDAIKKMRASSADSPSKGRTRMLPPSSSPLGRGSPLRYRTSPPKISAANKTPANSSKRLGTQLSGAPSLLPPKTTSKYNNSPIRQHDKLRANVQSMLETPQYVRNYNKKYPGRRGNTRDVGGFAIFEDNTSGPELESPLIANSAGRMLDELMNDKKNFKTPIGSSPFKAFPLFPPVDENALWAYDSPSKVLSPMKFSSPSKYLLQSAGKLADHDSENWIINGVPEDLTSELELEDLGDLEESADLDLTQTFRSIGERPIGMEPCGPSTLHRFG